MALGYVANITVFSKIMLKKYPHPVFVRIIGPIFRMMYVEMRFQHTTLTSETTS